jgi:hypothetical protein
MRTPLLAALTFLATVALFGCDGAAPPKIGDLTFSDGDGCPSRVPLPNGPACPSTVKVCVYHGIENGISSTDEPMACKCTAAGGWACVGSDGQGRTECPFENPPTTKCTTKLECAYPINFTIASCTCDPDQDRFGAPAGTWVCAL